MKNILHIFILLIISISSYAEELDEILEREEKQEEVADEKIENLNIKNVSQLEKLVPFNDIAVIQKRYLPRTGRFEFFPSIGLILNDAFFTNYVFGGKFSYHFSEKWGLEGTYLSMSQTEKDVVKKVEGVGAETTSLVTPNSYMGLDLKWIPIYGKMAFMDNKIVPFDFYFSFGAGSLDTNQSESPVAIHLGAGQSFAVTKYMALRWDTSFYWYNSKVASANNEEASYMNLHLTIGASFFFPEATYR